MIVYQAVALVLSSNFTKDQNGFTIIPTNNAWKMKSLNQGVAIAAANGEVVTVGVVLANIRGIRRIVDNAEVRASEDGTLTVLIEEILHHISRSESTMRVRILQR